MALPAQLGQGRRLEKVFCVAAVGVMTGGALPLFDRGVLDLAQLQLVTLLAKLSTLGDELETMTALDLLFVAGVARIGVHRAVHHSALAVLIVAPGGGAVLAVVWRGLALGLQPGLRRPQQEEQAGRWQDHLRSLLVPV